MKVTSFILLANGIEYTCILNLLLVLKSAILRNSDSWASFRDAIAERALDSDAALAT